MGQDGNRISQEDETQNHSENETENENENETGEQNMSEPTTLRHETEREMETREYLLTTTHYPTERLDTQDTIDFLESLCDALTIGSIAPGEHFTITRTRDEETTA